MFRTILSIVALMIASSQYCKAENYIESCAASLQKTDVTAQHNEILEYALLVYVVKNSTDEAEFKSKFKGLTGYGFLDGARKRLEYYEQKFNLHWSVSESQSYSMSYLPINSTSAFSDCVRQVFATPGVHLSLAAVSDSSVTLHVHYIPATAAEDPRSRFQVITNGELAPETNLNIPATGTLDEDLFFKRLDLADDLNIQIAVISHKKPIAGTSLQIPPHVTASFTEEPRPIYSGVSSTTCSGNNRWEYSNGADVTLDALALPDPPMPASDGNVQTVDYFLDMQTFVPRIITRHETGPGGCGNIVMGIAKPTLTDPQASTIRSISGHVVCEPGPQKDHFCDVAGRLEANRIKRTVTVHTPQGHLLPSRRLEVLFNDPDE
jgi:hypothetical protein